MIVGVDTNILVRFVMADDLEQATRARAALQSFSPQSPGFISLVCMAEFVWVLRSKYRQPKSEIVRWLEQFLDSAELVLEGASAVAEATRLYAQRDVDFADALIERSGRAAGCTETLTFDKKAASFTGMRLL